MEHARAILDTPDTRLPDLAREIAVWLEQDELPVRSVYLDPGVEGVLPVRGYIRVAGRAELECWAQVLGALITVEPGPLEHQTQEYAERIPSAHYPYAVRAWFTRRATDAEMRDR